METQKEVATKRQAILAEKLLKLNKTVDRNLGLKLQVLEDNDMIIVKVKSEIYKFETKKGKIVDAVLVDNLETGETGLTLFVGGQLKSKLLSVSDGFIGGEFAISHLGKEKVEMMDEETGELVTRQVNQFDVTVLK